MAPLARRALALAALWWLLGGGSADSWVVGAPAVLLAAAASLRLAPAPLSGLHWPALPGFVLLLLREMVYGGLQTARLTLFPRARLRPGFVTLSLALQGDTARAVLVNVMNLVPGTVSVAVDGDTMTLHVLDRSGPVAEEYRLLEGRVAALFGEAAA